MEGIAGLFVHQPVCLHHEGHIAGLHGHANVVKSVLFQQDDVGKGALHQGLRRGMAVFFQQRLIQAAAVDADTDGNMVGLAAVHHRPDVAFAADVTGIDADLRRATFGSGNGQTVVKMDVRHQRQRRPLRNGAKGLRRLHIQHRQADNVTAGLFQRANLLQTTLHVRVGTVEHGLDGHRCAAADLHSADGDLSCHSQPPNSWKISLKAMTAIRISSRIIKPAWR